MSVKLFRNANIFSAMDRGKPAAGKDQKEVIHYPKGALLTKEGIIDKIGAEKEILTHVSNDHVHQEIDCEGYCMIPGFVDPHTHMCFAKPREQEFLLRLEGTTYLDILRQGGGILSSVKAVSESSEDDLFLATLQHARIALRYGTTTLEIKSGYGLDTANELKMLRVISRVNETSSQDIIATFLGAHAIPPHYKDAADDYIAFVIENMLPEVKSQGIARHCDVFCEKDVFSIEQGRKLLKAAIKSGMQVKLHADEVHDLGGAGLAAELKALSADHLLAASDENLVQMASAGVIGTLLPATAYSLRKEYAPARKMIDLGLPVALATDCNPGSSFTESIPFVIGLAVLNMHMSPAEALTAATLNSAYALGLEKKVGSLELGKQADFLLLDGETPAILAYHGGINPVRMVYKRGEHVA